MGKIDDAIREEQTQILNSMKKRRDILNEGIAKLEYAIEHPSPPLNIDFDAIAEEARKDVELLEQYGKKCKERVDE